MKVAELAPMEFEINLDEDELSILCGCMNEVCNGFRLVDFAERIGAGRDETRAMLDTLFHAAWKDAEETHNAIGVLSDHGTVGPAEIRRGKGDPTRRPRRKDHHPLDGKGGPAMNALKTGENAFRITLTRQGLLILCRCIRETRHALPDWEFPIRVGGDLAEADAIRTTLLDAARTVPGEA